MDEQPNQVFYPSSYSELFSAWNRFPSAVIFAGGTGLIREQGRQILNLPKIIISLDRLEEMQRISRSERYLEIGAMVKLSQIIDLGKIVPDILRCCLENIAGPQLRNIATIGGNVCYPARRLDSFAALTALDAQFELKNAQSSRWISASRITAKPGFSVMNPQELLTRIRVPLDNWDYSAYRKFAGQANHSKVAVFLAKTPKNILGDIKIIYKNDMIWRNRNSESILIGKILPLGRRVIIDFIAHWETFLSGIGSIDAISRNELINFIKMNVYNLSE